LIDGLLNAIQYGGAFLLILGPLIVLHEFGHFIVAKAFRIGVPVFSVGIGPRLFGFKWGGTDYRFSAVPLGGYVRLHGDEADEMRSGAEDEFLSRPRWQRFLVYLAGPAVNIVTAWILFTVVLWAYGADELKAYSIVHEVKDDSPAFASGVREGDRILTIEGQDAREMETFSKEIMLLPNTVRRITVEREGRRLQLSLQTGFDPQQGIADPGWQLRPETGKPMLTRVLDGPARRAGLQDGDIVLGVNGEEPINDPELRSLLAESAGVELLLKVERAGAALEIPVTPEERKGRGIIGAYIGPSNLVHRSFGVGDAMGESVRQCVEFSDLLFVTLQRVIRRILPVRVFSGPIQIAQVARDMVVRGLEPVLWFMAIISLQLGILNLLPIPVLDGGHILILGVEAGMRRELSLRLKERVMQVGVVFLLLFFATILVLDSIKVLGGFDS
jgi:regulator of sigma E protease